MNDSVLVEALRARDPGALAALYDDYAEGLHAYASLMLGSPDGAQVALRDTLIAAEAHIEALADPGRLRAWLYALARGESLRRRSVPPAAQDDPEAGASDERSDGDLRRVAINAVAALPDDEREVLELLTRHAIPEEELPHVLGTTPARAGELHRDACSRLQDLVATEVLARDPAQECPDRRGILADFTEVLDDETRERLIEHAGHCPVCGPYRERQVSATKVFDLLPRPVLPQTLRVRVMSCFIDPELVPYRQFVARRTGLLDADGFPLQEIKGSRWRPQVLAGAVAAVAMALAALVLVSALNDRDDRLAQAVYGAFPPSSSASGVAPPAGVVPGRAGSAKPLGPKAEEEARGRTELPGAAVPVGVVRPDARVSVRPAGGVSPRPAPVPSRPAPVPPPAPRPSVSTIPFPPPPLTAPPSRPPASAPTVVPPTAPPWMGHPRPPRPRPPVRPAPTSSHQHRPSHTATTPAPSVPPPADPSVPPPAPPPPSAPPPSAPPPSAPPPSAPPPSEPGTTRGPRHEGHRGRDHWGGDQWRSDRQGREGHGARAGR
ncbi:RNA polymerase sigma factor [Sphaerisporangium album]|uniref:RNA polymerase sigma factor n=1 Tax=Sphaerisporangium album TaxID=509200 RepID=UPI0015F04526|nr:sigma-70 family RNA polymerase sigma factor [Sphaerisporangium album]